MQRRLVLGFMAAFMLAACAMPNMAGDPDRAAEATALYGDLVEGRDDALLARMSSANNQADLRRQLPMIRSYAPPGPAPGPKTIGWSSNAGTDGQHYSLAQEYEYPDRFIRTDVNFVKEGAAWKVLGFNVNTRMKPGASAPAAAPIAPNPVTPA